MLYSEDIFLHLIWITLLRSCSVSYKCHQILIWNYFYQLSGAHCTQKLVRIHNTQICSWIIAKKVWLCTRLLLLLMFTTIVKEAARKLNKLKRCRESCLHLLSRDSNLKSKIFFWTIVVGIWANRSWLTAFSSP